MKKLKLPEERKFIGPALVWKRMVAFVVDMLILDALFYLLFSKTINEAVPTDLSFAEKMALMQDQGNNGLMAVFFTMFFMIFLYFLILEFKFGQTIGKKLLNIYVTTETGKTAFWQALVRNIGFIPFLILPLLLIIDPFFMLFSTNSQTLSEKLSKTKSVEAFNYQDVG